MKTKETRKNIIQAGRKAVDELIKVAEEKIITHTEEDVSADRLKNAAATKKLCIMDAFEILTRIEEEEDMLTMGNVGDLIDYIPGNQLGFRHYKISLDENGDKYLEVIGDIEGYYDDVNYGLLGGKKNKKSKKRTNITRKKRA